MGVDVVEVVERGVDVERGEEDSKGREKFDIKKKLVHLGGQAGQFSVVRSPNLSRVRWGYIRNVDRIIFGKWLVYCEFCGCGPPTLMAGVVPLILST
jgi:hypothetical protein